MPVTEFDNRLREQYEQGNFEYKPASWERLSMQLPVKKKKPFLRRIFWLPMAAAAAVAAGFIVLPLLRQDRPDHRPGQAIARTAGARPAPAALPAARAQSAPATIVFHNNQPAAAPVASYAVSAAHNATKSASPIASTLPTSAQAQPALPAAIPTASQPDPAGVPQAAPVAQSAILLSENIPARPASRASAGYLSERPQFEAETRPKKFNPSSLSIAGGYKYGTTNTGYMVGINGRKSLGGRVFIESDFAFSNNRNAQVTNQTSAESFDQVKTLAGTNAVAARAVSRGEVVSSMSYLQVTPTVGYQLLRNMSVGAGADVQRLFQDKDETAYIMDGTDVKAVPQMDYGVVGKLEYSVTRNFKAGVQYRQGMNTVMAPEKNYLDRSYIQVQLKLGILGK